MGPLPVSMWLVGTLLLGRSKETRGSVCAHGRAWRVVLVGNGASRTLAPVTKDPSQKRIRI